MMKYYLPIFSWWWWWWCYFFNLLLIIVSNSSSSRYPFNHNQFLNNTQVTPLVQCSQINLDYTSKDSWCSAVIPKLINQYGYVPIGSACLANVRDLLPTQSAIGYSLLNCKTQIIQNKFSHGSQWLVDYLLDNPAPAIVASSWGHDWDIYLTDHHHLARSIMDAFPGNSVFNDFRWLKICVTEDLRMLSQSEFWTYLVNNGDAWLENRRGESISWYDLPHNLQSLSDDPFRSLSEYIRDAHGYIKCGVSGMEVFPACNATTGGQKVDNKPFFEFYWANFFRSRMIHQDRFAQLYDMDWAHQVELFNSDFQSIMRIALSPEAFSDSTLAGQNTQRAHVLALTINQSTGCDSLYGQLIIPDEFLVPPHVNKTVPITSGKKPHKSKGSTVLLWLAPILILVSILVFIFVKFGQCPTRLYQHITRPTMAPSKVFKYVAAKQDLDMKNFLNINKNSSTSYQTF